jgi:signal transduction histidine kinase
MERQRLGRELHTGVGQALAAIRLQLEVIATLNYPCPLTTSLHALRNIAP